MNSVPCVAADIATLVVHNSVSSVHGTSVGYLGPNAAARGVCIRAGTKPSQSSIHRCGSLVPSVWFYDGGEPGWGTSLLEPIRENVPLLVQVYNPRKLGPEVRRDPVLAMASWRTLASKHSGLALGVEELHDRERGRQVAGESDHRIL